MVPFPRNDNFIGQSHIEIWFKNYRKHWIASGQSEDVGHIRFALCGLGGVGKTQDVLSFIYKYKNQRPVFWIHAGSVTQFEADCRKLASIAQIPGRDDTRQYSASIVKQWLESPQSGDWILVLDNADNMLDFYPTASRSTESNDSETITIADDGIAKFLPRGTKGTVIVTTRDREVARNVASRNVIIKPELYPEQALELFYQHCPSVEDAANGASTPLKRLLQELQYLPLAIVQVAAYLDLNRLVSASEYLTIFESKKESAKLKRLLSKPHDNIWRDNGGNAETILTTFSISFRQIQQQSKLAGSFLRFMACIDRKAIPQDLLFQIALDGVEDRLLIAEALDKLVNFSILQHAKVDFGTGKGYEIHSLVHLAMQTYLESVGMDTALSEASRVLANALPDSGYETWAAWRVYLPHVMTLLANLKKDSKASADLCMQAGHHLFGALGRHSEAVKLHERAISIYTFVFGEDNAETLWAMTSLVGILRAVRRMREVREIEEKVLEVRRRTLGEEHPDTLISMQNLAVTYTQLGGRTKEAQELEEKVLEVRRRTLGEEHRDTLISTQNLAATYTELGGRLDEVQKLEEKVVKIRRRMLGEEHPDTLISMHNLVMTYKQRGGMLNEVKELQKRVLKVMRHTLGEEHPDTLRSMQNLADTYKELGARSKVRELEEKVLKVRRRALGEKHPDTLKSMQNV